MHTVMAALRAAGTFMEDSSLDVAWREAGLYGPLTTRQILEGKHLKWALNANLTTIQLYLISTWKVSFRKKKP